MKVLYLTCFETEFSSGIYESQVSDLLRHLTQQFPKELELTLLAVLPVVSVGRKRLSLHCLDGASRAKVLKQSLAEHKIRFDARYVPFVACSRWGFYLPLPLLVFALLAIVPLLSFRFLRRRYDIVHCRSYLATVAALLCKVFCPSTKIVFDPRGLYPEEGVVQRSWGPGSLSFRMWKQIERWAFSRSDMVICLSQPFAEYVREMEPRADCEVVHASVNLEQFRHERGPKSRLKEKLELGPGTVFVYSGSLGAWHSASMLCRVFRELKSHIKASKLLVLTPLDGDKLSRIFEAGGLDRDDFRILSCPAREVASYLAAADWAIVPLTESFAGSQAMRAIARTMIGLKVPEFLAAGLPLIINEEVGGMKSLLDLHRLGIRFSAEKISGLGTVVSNLKPEVLAESCRQAARREFDIASAAQKYFGIYWRLYKEVDSDTARIATV